MPVILLSKPIFQILFLEGLSLISNICRPWMCSLSQDLLLESCLIMSNTQMFFFFSRKVSRKQHNYSLGWKSIFVCFNKLLGTSLAVWKKNVAKNEDYVTLMIIIIVITGILCSLVTLLMCLGQHLLLMQSSDTKSDRQLV